MPDGNPSRDSNVRFDPLEEAELAEKQQRRAVARQVREESERAEAVTETMVNAAWGGPLAAQRAVQDQFGGASQIMSGAGESAWSAVSSVHQHQRELVALASRNLQTFVDTGLASAQNMQDLSAACINLSRQRLEKNFFGMIAMLGCRSITELSARQNALLLENMELTVAGTRSLAQAAAGGARKKAQTSQTEQ